MSDADRPPTAALARELGSTATLAYGASRLAPPLALVDLAAEIERADASLGAVINAELTLIAEQIRHLQAQARRCLDRARASARLHRASCAFRKRVGAVYHLYERDQGPYFSMLSPREWGGQPPHPYLGSYRLGPDLAWQPVDPDDPSAPAPWIEPAALLAPSPEE